MESVENILRELNLSDKKRIIVFNKADKAAEDEIKNIALRYNAIYISALRQSTFNPLLDVIEQNIWDDRKFEGEKMRSIRNLRECENYLDRHIKLI